MTNMLRALPAGSPARARHHLVVLRHYAVAADSTLERARAHPGRYAYTPDGGCWVIVRDGWWTAGDSGRDEMRAADRAHPAVHPARLGAPFTPADAGPVIGHDDDPFDDPFGTQNGARVVLLARDHGWDGRDADEPGTDITGVAARALAGVATAGEIEALAFRYAGWAEEWLDRHAAPAGHNFGWLNGVFYLQTVTWWEANGGPDQMFL